MKLNYTIERPTTLPAGACAPTVSVSAFLAALPTSAPVAVLAAERAPASRAHQVQIQAELVRTLVGGSYSTTGFTGGNGTDPSMKRRVDGGSGVPPRGRPV